MKKIFRVLICGILAVMCLGAAVPVSAEEDVKDVAGMSLKDFIKWVDFCVTAEVLSQAYEYDVKSGGKIKWIELLAYSAAKNGNKFTRKKCKYIEEAVKLLGEGKSMAEIGSKLKYYDYYCQAYTAVLGGYLGHFRTTGGEIKYGLKVYHPIAKGYWVSSYDDFGNKRGYGFARRHLGNDLMGSVGTPIIAVEGGEVYEVGWNQYGGWRIGIMSADKKRYYYYAHLRKNKPYYKEFVKGEVVQAGDILGYLGNTGYSIKENTNMKSGKPHLHYGLQLIFDPSQIDCNSEIWIDNFEILKFLSKSKMGVQKTEQGLVVKREKHFR